MTRDVIPDSRSKGYDQQQKLVSYHADYSIPQTLEAATCILMEYAKGGKCLYTANPWTYTRCQEQTFGYPNMVGSFAPSGLHVTGCGYGDVSSNCGVGALRKF